MKKIILTITLLLFPILLLAGLHTNKPNFKLDNPEQYQIVIFDSNGRLINTSDIALDSLDLRILTIDTCSVFDKFLLYDTNISNSLQLKWNENDTSDRILNFLLDGGNRSLTIEGDSKINQDLTTDADVTFDSLYIRVLKLNAGTDINEFSTDGTLAGNSDDAVPTEKAIKTYIDALGAGVWTRSGTTLSPANAGDDIDGTGGYLLDNQSITNLSSNGASYWFNGVDGKINCGTDITDNNLTVIAKIKVEIPLTDGGIVSTFDMGGWKFALDNMVFPTNIYFGYRDNPGNYVKVVSTETIDDNSVNIVGVTFNGSTKAINLYLNGNNIGSGIGTDAKYAQQTVYIGYNINNMAYFNGSIYDVKLFNHPLTATEIKDLYSGAEIPYKYIGASQSTVATYDSSQAVSDAFTLVLGKAYRWTKGSADSLVSNSVTYTTDTTFVAGATSGTAYGDLSGSDLIRIGCVANYTPEGIGNYTWQDVSGNELHGIVSNAIPFNLPADDEQIAIEEMTDDATMTDAIPDGYILEYIIVKNQTANADTLDFGTSEWASDIASAQVIAGNTQTVIVVNQYYSDETDISVSDTNANGWNSNHIINAILRRIK